MNKLKLLVFILAGAGLFLTYRGAFNRTQVVPKPYFFSESTEQSKNTAQIVVLGDRLGHRLGKYQSFMSDIISVQLTKSITINNMAMDGDGIHRSLQKLQKLNPLPKIVLYLGGSQEHLEKRFAVKDLKTISSNFKLYKDPNLQTMMLVFPLLSRFIYEPVQYTRIQEQTVVPFESLDSKHTPKVNEVLFELYYHELEELINFCKEKGIVLFLASQPLNLDAPPKKSCPEVDSRSAQASIKQLKTLIEEGDIKTAYSKAKKLSDNLVANSEALYYLGQTSKRLGKTLEAKEYLEKSQIYDCQLWRGNNVYNAILKKLANKHQVFHFDFYQLVNDEWLKNETFLDEVYPQELYFERAAKSLAKVIKRYLRI